MNIGFDASRAFVDKKTGTENYSHQLLKYLLQLDQANNYYIYTRDSSQESVVSSLVNSNLPSTNYHLPTIPLSRLWTQVGLAARTFIDPLDVLFIPSHTLPIIRKPGLKTVLTVHDLG